MGGESSHGPAFWAMTTPRRCCCGSQGPECWLTVSSKDINAMKPSDILAEVGEWLPPACFHAPVDGRLRDLTIFQEMAQCFAENKSLGSYESFGEAGPKHTSKCSGLSWVLKRAIPYPPDPSSHFPTPDAL